MVDVGPRYLSQNLSTLTYICAVDKNNPKFKVMHKSILLSLTLAFMMSSSVALAEEPVTGLLVCARTILEKRLGGETGIDEVARFISEARDARARNDVPALQQIEYRCGVRSLQLTKSAMSRDDQFDYIDRLSDISAAVREFLEQFIRPSVECHKIGLQAQAGLFLTIGLKVDGSYCVGTNGRKWLEISPGVAGGFGGVIPNIVTAGGAAVRKNGGIGVAVGVNWGPLSRTENYHQSFITGGSTDLIAGGLVFGGATETEKTGGSLDQNANKILVANPLLGGGGEEHQSEMRLENCRVSSIGLGLGVLQSRNLQANIKIVPLGTDEDLLDSEFDRIAI
jgi:hypothetical protein